MFVFISCNHQELGQAQSLQAELRAIGVDAFFYDTGIEWGGDIPSEVQRALAQTTHLVIVVSPEAVKSPWVNFEVGVAVGLNLRQPNSVKILPWIAYPTARLPHYIAHRRHLDSKEAVMKALADERTRLAANEPFHRLDECMYYRSRAKARALRLVGAADEHFPPSAVHVIPSDAHYVLPPDMLTSRSEVLGYLTKEADAKGAVFFNGPHTRLVGNSISSVEGPLEQKHLTLRLARVDWYDFSVTKWFTDRADPGELAKWVDLDQVAASGTVSGSKLHNILDTATTLITNDGYVLYAKRGGRQSVERDKYTCAVAENIHTEKDQSLQPTAVGSLPAPFRAAWRGIGEELSQVVLDALVSSQTPLLFLGLSFDLVSFHPDALFLVCLPMSREQVLQACRDRPGPDFFEGKLQWVSVFDEEAVLHVLGQADWLGGGKAAVIRALEFIEATASRAGVPVADMIRRLSLPSLA